MKKVFIPILILINVLVFAWFIFPQREKYLEFTNKFKTEQTNLTNYKNYLNKVKDVSEELKIYSEKEILQKVNNALPQGPETQLFLAYLEKTVSETGLILKEINLFLSKEGQRLKELKETKITFKIVGDYSSFKEFLKAVENSSRLIEIEDLKIESKGEKELPNYILSLKIYSY